MKIWLFVKNLLWKQNITLNSQKHSQSLIIVEQNHAQLIVL